MNRPFPRRLARLMGGGAICLLLAGCSTQVEPQRYEVPREASPARGGVSPPKGPPEGKAPSIALAAPEGWTVGRAGGMRKAAYLVEDGPRQVEITVVDLAARAGDLLANVNIWRGQLELDPITRAELDGVAIPIRVAGAPGHYVEMAEPDGKEPRRAILAAVVVREDRAWFFKLWGDAELAAREKNHFEQFVRSARIVPGSSGGRPPEGAIDDSAQWLLEYDAPEGWTAGEARGVCRAAFSRAEGDQRVEITALAMPGAMDSLLLNVNLWRRKVRLDEITQAEFDEAIVPIEVGGSGGDYFELVGPEDPPPRQAILRVVAIRGGTTWLLSMTGDAQLALREKERFLEFVKSIRFTRADRAEHGG